MTKGEKEVIKSTPRGPACLMLPYWIHMLQFEAAHFCPILPLTSPETMARHNTQVAPEGSGTAVMACLLPGASSTELLLKTAKLAARDLRGDFFAVCVSPPRGLFFKPASSLDSDLTYASSFGANTVRLVSRDAAGSSLLEMHCVRLVCPLVICPIANCCVVAKDFESKSSD
jgi:hypothetical protein